MSCNNNTMSESFNYVWQVKNAKPEPGKTIPVRNGDFLFVCVDPNGSAHFRYRKRDWRQGPEDCETTRANADEWGNATAKFEDGKINGHFTNKVQFTMSLTPNEDGIGFLLRCNLFVNPPEGDFEGDDVWR